MDPIRHALFDELEKIAVSKHRLTLSSSRKGRRPMSVDTLLKKEKDGTLYKKSKDKHKVASAAEEAFVMNTSGAVHQSMRSEFAKIAREFQYPQAAYHEGVLAVDHPSPPPAAMEAYRNAKFQAYTPQVMDQLHQKQQTGFAAQTRAKMQTGSGWAEGPNVPTGAPQQPASGPIQRAAAPAVPKPPSKPMGGVVPAAAQASRAFGATPAPTPGPMPSVIQGGAGLPGRQAAPAAPMRMPSMAGLKPLAGGAMSSMFGKLKSVAPVLGKVASRHASEQMAMFLELQKMADAGGGILGSIGRGLGALNNKAMNFMNPASAAATAARAPGAVQSTIQSAMSRMPAAQRPSTLTGPSPTAAMLNGPHPGAGQGRGMYLQANGGYSGDLQNARTLASPPTPTAGPSSLPTIPALPPVSPLMRSVSSSMSKAGEEHKGKVYKEIVKKYPDLASPPKEKDANVGMGAAPPGMGIGGVGTGPMSGMGNLKQVADMPGVTSNKVACIYLMSKAAGLGSFLRNPSTEHGVELAGLGILGVPAADHLQALARSHMAGEGHGGVEKRKMLGETGKEVAELGGLGVLAAPSIAHLMHH